MNRKGCGWRIALGRDLLVVFGVLAIGQLGRALAEKQDGMVLIPARQLIVGASPAEWQESARRKGPAFETALGMPALVPDRQLARGDECVRWVGRLRGKELGDQSRWALMAAVSRDNRRIIAAGQAGQPMEQGVKRKAQFPPTFADVKYGPHDANVLDFWQTKSQRPTPLLIAFHGGGFRQGSKDQFSTVLFDECRAAGISFATVEYRLSQVAPYPAQMHDCGRAVQFLRHNAQQWNLDPAGFVATGGSAGAGISLWLAFHDDLADPQSKDAVARESTRLRCALVTGMQSTYDPREIRRIVPGKAYDAQPIKQLFGLPDAWNWDNDKVDAALDARVKDASPITHLSKDDVPVFVVSYRSMNVTGNIHHSNFAKHLKQQMDKLGIQCIIRMDTDYAGGMAEAHQDMAKWMKRQLWLPATAEARTN